MDAQDVERIAWRVLSDHKDYLIKEIESWPHEACFDTCSEIFSDLRQALRGGRLTMVSGRYGENKAGHTWLKWKNWIIDPTHGQFSQKNDLLITKIDDERYRTP